MIGFDIERHDYGTGGYPGQLVLQDVLTLHGSQFRNATVIVASPPCQAYSYKAMPWKRAKALPPPDNTLFETCFRIQREAREAAGRHIPLIVENVRGAQKWVGRAKWHFGSYYLWGDVPALMPIIIGKQVMKAGVTHRSNGQMSFDRGVKVSGINTAGHWTNPNEHEGVKQALAGMRTNGKGSRWFQDGAAKHGSRSDSRKAASAMIAKIPFHLACHIARVYKPYLQDGQTPK